MLNNISTYLNNENYRISVLPKGLHVLNYKNIVDITDYEAILKIGNKTIRIYGKSLTLVKLDKKELLLSGIIKKVEINEHQ